MTKITDEQKARFLELAALNVLNKKQSNISKGTEPRIVEACPICDYHKCELRNKTNDYRCARCHGIFEQPVQRPRKPKLVKPKLVKPSDPSMVLACPSCDHRVNSHQCHICGAEFDEPVQRPRRPRKSKVFESAGD